MQNGFETEIRVDVQDIRKAAKAASNFTIPAVSTSPRREYLRIRRDFAFNILAKDRFYDFRISWVIEVYFKTDDKNNRDESLLWKAQHQLLSTVYCGYK